MKNKEELENKTGIKCISSIDGIKRFSCCVMNPPYAGKNPGDSIYIDFINNCLEISDKLVVVSPLTGFLGHNEHGSAAGKNVKLHNLMDEYKPSIEEVKNEFDAGIKGKVGISVFDKSNIPEKIKIKYLTGHEIKVDEQINIIDNNSEYLNRFKGKLFKFMIGENINQFINLKHPLIYVGRDKSNIIKFKHDNLYNHIYYGKNGEGLAKFTCKIEKNIDKDKLYIFLMKANASFNYYTYKQTRNCGIPYEESWFEKSLCYIKCDSLEESKNICEYLNTDFCALILKLRAYFHGYLKYDFVPWLDFSKSYTDEKLFNMIGMKYDKSEINKILNK